ncbi:heme-binding beta-barrel domain-containing protein [Pseudonocardia phyllosphaerae]|uniref:FABP family protein n=1 Tax=Pseudonocardia phyllosphaerae TaxID=3390502 RepID=UPI0039797ED5
MTEPDSGSEELQTTITGPENAAPDSPQRNLPLWEDLPVTDDTANLRHGPDLHQNNLGVLPLVGVWRGEGELVDPTSEEPKRFGQQLVFAHDGRPFLSYEARAWLLDDNGEPGESIERETGFWRPQEDGSLEVLLADSNGLVEVFYGPKGDMRSWEIQSDAVARTATARETVASKRLYGLVNQGDLAYVDERALDGGEMKPYMSAVLHRVVG